MTRHRLTTKKRRELYHHCRGSDDYPTCNLCGLLVMGAWDVSHVGAPAALGGTEVGIAHRTCNRRDNNEHVTPMVAKAKRVFDRDRDIHRSSRPLPCGRDDRFKKTLDGGIVERRNKGIST